MIDIGKLCYIYAGMNSSKTANALMTAYGYRERGLKPLLVKPRIDNRDGERVIKSRAGLQEDCIYIDELDIVEARKFDCVIVDECQFLTEKDILLLLCIVDGFNIQVICYGLRTDFKGNLFEGSKLLLAWADKIEEIESVCWCGKNANFNARIQDGKVVKEGEQIVLGKEDKYISLCRKHWFEGNLGNNMK